MKHFYENNEDHLRSKLNNHEFEFSAHAWDDMAKRLDKIQRTKAGAAGWWKWVWVSMGAMMGVAGVGLGLYWGGASPMFLAVHPTAQPTKATTNIETNKTTTIIDQNAATTIGNVAEVSAPVVSGKAEEKQQAKGVNTSEVIASVQRPSASKGAKGAGIAARRNKIENAVAATLQAVETPEVMLPVAPITADNQASATVLEAAENRQPTRVTRVSYQYSLSPLHQVRVDSVGQVRLREQTADKDSSLFSIERVRDHWKSRWKLGLIKGIVHKQYNSTGHLTMSAFTGAFVRWNATSKHGIEMGLQYKYLPYTKYNEDSEYSFTAGTNNTGLIGTIRDFHLLELPIAYRFSPHRKHHVSAGVKGSWLIAVGTHSPLQSPVNNRKTLGLNALDASVFLGYEFSLCDHLSLGFQYNIGLLNWSNKAARSYASNLESAGFDTQDIPDVIQMNEKSIPTAVDADKVFMVPRKIRNNDLQVFVKYTF